jgi:hypothetical protein
LDWFWESDTGVALEQSFVSVKKCVLPTSQTGTFPIRWLPTFSYMSDVYQGSWNLSLADGGVEAVPVLVPLQIRRQFLGGQYTDTLEVNPQPGAVVRWYLNGQAVAGGSMDGFWP